MTESSADPSELTEAFREALSRRADTVHLVSYRAPGGRAASMTATAVSALSLTPPALLVCLARASRTRAAVLAARTFVVNILRDTQLDLALASSRSGQDKTIPPPSLGQADDQELLPILPGSLASFSCRVLESHEVYTHTVIVGEVTAIHLGGEGPPLLHHRGGYVLPGERLR